MALLFYSEPNNMPQPAAMAGAFPGIDFATTAFGHERQHLMKQQAVVGVTSSGGDDNRNQLQMVDNMLKNPPNFCGSTSFDKLSFADVMQFADFGSKLALNQSRTSDEDEGFPVLNDVEHSAAVGINKANHKAIINTDDRVNDESAYGGGSENAGIQLQFLGSQNFEKNSIPAVVTGGTKTTKRKRPRTAKTSEEVESRRMTHIAVERNRRKQMNEHLRVLRSLMPGSYVQRGDQASIIGGAIEFVRELEQLLQCLESQKRRRLYGDGPRQPATIGDNSSGIATPQQAPFCPADDQTTTYHDDETTATTGLLQEDSAESKSCLADVEVRLVGLDGMIKILCRRRGGQLIKTIAALEEMQLNILHANITTIEQTVLYCFNVKVGGEASRYTAEDIASSVQQIISFIHANTNT